MGLNKQTGNMYDWISKTKNPLCGVCEHSCRYCFVERRKKRFLVIRKKYSGEIRLDERVLSQKLGSRKFYFIQSMGDLFADNVKSWYIMRVIHWLNEYPDNTYLLQSKNPDRFIEFAEFFPRSTVFATTIESNKDYEGMSKAPCIQERVKAMIELRKMGYRTMVTIEPVLDFDVHEMVVLLKLIKPEWINLGADSGNNNLQEPSKEKLLELMSKVEIRQKKNLKRLLK